MIPPFPYVKLLESAERMGDADPTSAVWVRSTRQTAVSVTSGEWVNSNQPVIVAVITGRFTDTSAPVPNGATAPSGTVATYVFDAATGAGLDFGLTSTMPDLRRVGRVESFLPYLILAASGSSDPSSAAAVETQWLERISAGVRLGCRDAANNPPEATVEHALATGAAADDFRISELEFLRGCRQAPVVVLASRDPKALAAKLARLEQTLDPVRGRRYEALYLEVTSEAGTPAIVIWNERAEAVGGQWAAPGTPYPAPHGWLTPNGAALSGA
jgi:hypothetical protein